MKVKSYWLLATAVYFCASFYVLWHYAGPNPSDCCGFGYTPGFSLPGLRPPSVSLREYVDSAHVRFQYRIPYFAAAFVFTLLGGIAPSRFLLRYPRLGKHPFAASMGIGLVLLLTGPAALDAGTHLNLWREPVWFSHGMVRLMIMVFLPLALLSGIVAVGARRFRSTASVIPAQRERAQP
jgi:hypothetical protein